MLDIIEDEEKKPKIIRMNDLKVYECGYIITKGTHEGELVMRVPTDGDTPLVISLTRTGAYSYWFGKNSIQVRPLTKDETVNIQLTSGGYIR